MAKRLNSDIQIGMSFVADTTSAQKAIQQLNSQIDSLLTKHSNPTNADFTRGLTEESKKAQAELAKLKVSLEGAVNANTGKLDLSQFHQSLKASGTNLSQLKDNLSKFGVAGDKAFANLTRSIISAEAPLRKTNGLLTEFATTLKNTARWQISSSILHGFMGSIQHAYYYAQDLNESLNNIRIVTSNSTDEMAKFAKQANEAAKSLSTTTTQYTDAALIYYQQGLNDKQVKERTDVTMKMANVAGESAQTVSDQMTAVWNNFDDGSQSLEHYADVLTALGAATASSTSEITEGLEKFAATANTVGLSYEYATSALATVTATTRQSADVVGTSFKTLFARIQGLQLGDTLDDGTDLNKYSKALASVGISIKEENGEMKKMDTILDEMGAKWGTLAKDQQVALAETVAGVRQYTQMIALMDHWDFFKQNLETANNSTGALQDQADIYAESWEAASKRVKAAAETIYSDLLNDDFFISLTDGLAKVLEGVDGLIKGLGGVPGILTLTGTIATKVFQQQIAGGIKNLGDGLKSFFGGTKDSAMGLKKEANDLMKDNPMGGSMVSESAKNTMNAAYQSQIEVQDMVIEKTKNLSTEQQKVVQQLQKQHQLSVDIAVETAEAAEAAEKEARAAARRVKVSGQGQRDKVTAALKGVKRAEYLSETAQNTQWHNQDVNTGDVKKAQEQALVKLKAIDTSKLTKQGRVEVEELKKKLQGTMKDVQAVDNAFVDFCTKADGLAEHAATRAKKTIGKFDGAEEAIETARTSGAKESENDRAGSVMKNSGDAVKGVIKNYNEQPMSFGDKFAAATQGAVAFAGALTSLSTTVKTLGDNSASSGEKVEALVMGLSSMAMQLSIVPWETVGAGLAKIGTSAAAAVPALGGLTTALGATATGLIAVTGPLAAAVAVGAFLAWAYQAHKFGSTAEGALEKAQNGVKAMREEVEKTTQRVESLRSSFDEYQTVVSELDKCKKGTEEWNDALQKVNSTVMDLMANPNLASIQGLFKNEDGHLAIDEDVYQQAMQKAEQAQINSKSVLSFAELDKQKAQNRVNLEGLADLSDKNRSRGMYEETEMSSASNTLSLDYLARQLANGVVLSDEADASIKAWADANGETVQEIKNQLTTTAESIKTEALARDNLIKAKISELAKGTEYEDDSKAQEEMAEAFTNYLDSEIEKLDKDLNNRETDENEKQLLALYNQAIGANYQSAEYKGIKENRRVVFTDEDGNEGQEIPIHEILAAIAQANTSLSSIDNYIKEIPDKIEGLKKEKGLSKDQKSNLDNLKHILKEGNMDNLSTEEFKKVGEGTVNWENPKYNEIATAFQQEYGMSLQKAADELGTSAKALSEKIISSHEKTEANIKSLNLDDPNTLYGLSTKGKSVETLTSEKNALDNAFKTLGQAGLDSLKGIIKQIPLEAQNALTEDGFDWNSIDSIDDLKKALASVNVTITDGLLDNMQAFTDKLKEHKKILDDFNIDESRDKARSGRKAYEEVTTSKDGSISEDSYNKLTPEMQEFFAATEDGTYKLISSAEEFLKVVTSIEGSYEKTLDRNQEVVNRIEQFSSYGGNINTDLTHDAYNEETGKVDKDYLRQQIAAVALTNKTVSSDQIDKFKEDVNTKSDKELAETSKQILNLLQGKDGLDGSSSLKEFKDTKQEEITNAEMKDAFLAKNGAELDDKLKNGEIGKDAYNNALTSMNNTTDADLDSGKVKEYGEAISEASEKSEEFSDDLKENKDDAEDVAESLMRYDDAVRNVSEGYDEWKSAIDKMDENGGVLDPGTIDELRDAYGDMFDIDASHLSNEFLSSAENLELLKKAAEGSAEAYDELQAKTRNDILIGAHLDEDKLATVGDMINNFINDQEFQDLEIGAEISPEKHQRLLDMLSEIVNAAGLTASEAQDLLTGIGVDAEVVQETEPETTTVPTYSYKPEKSGSLTIDDGDSKREIWGYNYIPQTDVKTIKSGKTVTSLKVTSGHKTAGGGIKAKRAPAPPASKGGGGGGKKGGGGSAPSTIKKTKTDIDRYWDINNAISKTSHEMEKLAKAKEKMSGSELIDALTKENKLLEQQKKNYQALLKEQQKELSEVIGKIKKKGGSFSGNKLKNYKSLMKKAGQKLHKKENAYNKWTKSKKAKGKDGKATSKKKLNGVKKAQEEYAELEKLVSRYQQLQYDAIEETKAKMEELLVQEIENNFEKFEIKIKVKADMQDLKKDLNDIQTLFKTDFTKAADDATNWATKMKGAVKNFSTLFSGKTMEQNRKEAQDKLDKYNVKASADQILAAQHEDNKKALQTKADKDYESAKKAKAKRLVKKLGKKQRKKLYKKFGGKKNLNKKIDKGDKKAINAAFKADFDKKENARIKKLKKKDLKKLKKVKGKSAKAKLKKKTYKKKKFKDTDKTSWAKKKKKKITKKLNKDIAADKKKLGVKGLKVKEVTDPLGKLVQNFGSNSALTPLYDQFVKLNAEKDHFMNGGKKGKSFISTSLSDATEKLKENGKQILDELQKVYNQAKETWDTYLQGVEGVIAEQDKIRSQLDDLYSSLENRGSIAELLWDTNSSAYLNKNEGLIKQQMQIKAQEVKDLNNMNVYYKGQMDAILKKNGGTIYDEDYLKYQEKVRANNKQIESDTIERIKLEQSLQQNSINKALNNLDNNIWGKSFEDVKQDWEETLAFQDKYLSKAQATYKIQSLSNTIQKDIDNTKDLKIQQKLNDFREEEIAHLREKNKLEKDNRALTQDDVDLAQARYDILLKEIALENARNNKNSMKVVRNQEGNWSYQYVADNGDVEDKQQQLLDAWAAYNEKADEAYKNATQLAMDEYQTHRDKLAKMAQDRKYYNEQGLFDATTFNNDMKDENDKYMAHIKTAFDNSAAHQKEVTYSTVGTLAQAYQLDEQNVEGFTAKETDAVLNFGNSSVAAYGGIKDELIKVFGPGGEGEEAIKAFNEKTIPSLKTTASETAVAAGKAWGDPENDTSESQTFYGYFKAAMEGCQASALTYFGEGKDGSQGIKGILNDAKESAGNLTTGIEELTKKIAGIDNKKLNELKTGLNKARGSAHKAKSAIGEIAGVIDSVAEELKKVAKEVKAVGDATKKKPTKYSKKWYKNEIKTYKGFKKAKTNEAKVDYLKGLYKDKKNDKDYKSWLKEQKNLKSKMGKTKKEKNRLKTLNKKIKHRKNYLKAIDELKKKYAGKIEGASKGVLEKETTDQNNSTSSQTADDTVDTDTDTDDDETQTGTDAETIQDGVTASLSSVIPNDFAQNVMKNTAEALQQQQALLDKTDENTPKIAKSTADLANVTSEVKSTIDDIQNSIAEDIKTTLSDILTSEKDFISKFDLMSKNLENKEFNNIYNIKADFPNAKDVDTIKQAILSLPNLVSQKNNSKTKKKK